MNRMIAHTFVLAVSLCASASCGYCADAVDKEFNYDSKGKRDPLVSLVGQERSIGAGLETIVSPDDLKLEGIATGAGGKQIAIINGYMVKEKDKFGALLIKKILHKSVEISIEGRDCTLTLQEPEEENAPNKK